MLNSHGRVLVEYILQAIAGASPRSHLDSLSDILLSLNKNFITQLSAWLQVCTCALDISFLIHHTCLGATSTREFPFGKCQLNRQTELCFTAFKVRTYTYIWMHEFSNSFSFVCFIYAGPPIREWYERK